MGGMSLGPASCSGRSISSVSGYLYYIITLLHCIVCMRMLFSCMQPHPLEGKARQGKAGQGRTTSR